MFTTLVECSQLAVSWSSLTCQKPELAPRTAKIRHSGHYFFNCSHWIVLTFDGSVEVTWVNADAELSVILYDSLHRVYSTGGFTD